MMDRRDFLKAGAAVSVASLAGCVSSNQTQSPTPPASGKSPIIWANLLQLSMNMWCDWDAPELKGKDSTYRPYLRFDQTLWEDLLKKMQQTGMNMVVMDLGDGIKYQSRPEIAVKGAWTTAELRRELKRMRTMGLEPIPALNFSASHDVWLGKYSRCVSTDEYYGVCRDLIAEVNHLFDRPRFFHLGMDEEEYENQKNHEHIVVRQFDAWWRDFLFLAGEVENGGARPWIWSDYVWRHPQLFYERMPRTVIQSNWYYDATWDSQNPRVKVFQELEKHGFDQVPTGSNYYNSTNFVALVEKCRQTLNPDHVLGFFQTPWKATLEKYRTHHMEAIDQVAQAMQAMKSEARVGRSSILLENHQSPT